MPQNEADVDGDIHADRDAAAKHENGHEIGRVTGPATERATGPASDAGAPRAAHDFSRVPPRSGAQPLQRQLAIGSSSDPLEAQADRLADLAVAAPAGASPSAAPLQVQRATATATATANASSTDRADGTANASATAPASVHRVLAGDGRRLEPSLRLDMEQRFGQDFSGVRVHSGPAAEQSARDIDAKAYTVGSDIVFGAGQYRPRTPAGRHLLAHELAHVAQQQAGAGTPRGAPGSARLWRKPSSAAPATGAQAQPEEEWRRLQVFATGMDHAAQLLAAAKLSFDGAAKRNLVFIGLHPKFVKVYDATGKSLGKIALKEVKGLVFKPGVYVQGANRIVALTVSNDDKRIGTEKGPSLVGQRPFTEAEKASMADDAKKAQAAGQEPKPAAAATLDFVEVLSEPARFRSLLASVPDALAIYFVPTYDNSGAGKSGGESKGLYASPIEGRGDGQPANAPPWPVSAEGPKLVPIDSDPTYSAKVDWAANGNFSVASQVISQVGSSIHYQWDLFDITQYAKKQIAKDPAGTQSDPAAKPEKSLQQRIDDFKSSQSGSGTDVTGGGGANREFHREFEDWWKDTQRAKKGTLNPGGDTKGERMSNAMANMTSLELAPISLLTTALGATMRRVADLFAGPRQQQEIPLQSEGIFLVRVITTPAITEDLKGEPVIRPPSVAAKLVEVTPMDTAVQESLDEPGAQMAELQSQIDLAVKAGNTAKADYLRSLLAEAKQRFEGSPLTLLTGKRNDKQKELDQFRKDTPSLSDYSRAREVEMLDDQIALYQHHEKERTAGATGLGAMVRVNATLISEVSGEQYPLLISAGPMAKVGSNFQWMISDVTNREGDAFTGLGGTESEAFRSALIKFGKKAAYGRGRIGARTAGLGLDAAADETMFVDSAPADWALAEKRIDDLVTTLAALGLMVASAGTAGALIGAGIAAARLIQRWQAGKLYLDAQTVSDALGVLGGLGVASQLAAGLRIQKFDKVFALVQKGRATEAEIAAAARALESAQQIGKGVELANEAINYGGLLWGNVSFVDQMISIGEQESVGAMTHAAARRARAGAISSAVQNNGLFIAGNVIKAKHEAKAADKAAPKPTEKPAPRSEKSTVEPNAPVEKVPAIEKAPVNEPGAKDSTEAPGDKPAEKAPRAAEPVPMSERRATLEELRAALPADLHEMLTIDESLHGDDARVDYRLDPATGLIAEIRLRCGPDARPGSVAVHAETVRTMQKYQGFSGRVRQAISWVADIVGVDTLKPENKLSFEAALEIRKLPQLIEAQMARMKALEPNAHDLAEAELAHLQLQLEQHLRTLDLGGGAGAEGAGYVAGKGLSKAKQKQYAELLAKLRGLEPGTDSHKGVRREMYELIGGDMPYAVWEKVYAGNVLRARKANKIVAAEHERLGWGQPEQTVDVGKGEVRRLDIANVKGQKGIEVKAYETGYISASEDIVWEVERDARLVRRGWDITWVLIDTEPSGPLQKMLLDAGITIEHRTLEGGGRSKFESRVLPPVKSGAKPKP